MKCLVTGGAGFIGSHVVDELIHHGHEVVVVDDLSGGFKKNINESARFVCADIKDTESMNKLFEEEKFDYVFHLAAYAAEGLSPFIRKFNYDTNLIGSINLINASVKNKIKCFVFTSSIAVYGTNQLPMTEDLTPHPEDPYGISKYAVELDLEAAHKQFGLNYLIFRPHNVYGPRQNIGDKYRNVVGIFMNNLLKDRKSIVFGDGTQTRSFTHVSNVAPIIALSVKRPEMWNDVYNLGSDTPYSINDLTKILGIMKIKYEPARKEVKHAEANHDKIKKFFPGLTEISLQEGINGMWNWALAHGARTSSEFKNIEITEGLPESWKS